MKTKDAPKIRKSLKIREMLVDRVKTHGLIERIGRTSLIKTRIASR